MKHDTYIVSNWTKEVVQAQKASFATRYHYYKEFRESYCDLFDMRDFHYYAEMIGCDVVYLLRMAKRTTDPDYRPRARDLGFRRWFYRNHGHSITKPFQYDAA